MPELCGSRRFPVMEQVTCCFWTEREASGKGWRWVSVSPRAFRSAAPLTLPQKPVSTAVPQILFVDFLVHGEMSWLYLKLRGGSWPQGLAVLPVHSRKKPAQDPAGPQATTTSCSWEMAMPEASRPGTGFWSPRGRAAGGHALHPPTPTPYTQCSLSRLGRWRWPCLRCALAAQGEGGCRDGAWLPPPPGLRGQGYSWLCPPSPQPSLLGRAGRTASPEPLPRICIFEATDTDRGFNESKVASRALTDARPRYYF